MFGKQPVSGSPYSPTVNILDWQLSREKADQASARQSLVDEDIREAQ